jgi:Spy/CpxP family protein refolding chaperone
MFEKIRLSSAALIAVLSVSGAVVVAQDQQPATTGTPQIQKQKRGDRLGRRGKGRHMRGQKRDGGLRGLDLTDQQKEQARAIRRASFESNKAQIEELKQLRQKGREALTDADKARAKELHKQLRESRLSARNQMSSLLTAEQKTKLEER